MPSGEIFIGCAGWSLSRDQQQDFPGTGSHLHRYAGRLNAVEINSSFYRSHQTKTYARWADSVPPEFRFSVKIPKTITHQFRLKKVDQLLAQFMNEAQGLGEKGAVYLVQLPPSLKFHGATAEAFVHSLRNVTDNDVVLEPRHPSWFTPDVEELLIDSKIARVAADPACVPAAAQPGGWPGVKYFRLHGSPQVYYSSYGRATLQDLAIQFREGLVEDAATWCVFDNTAAGAALENATALTDYTRTCAGGQMLGTAT